MSKLTERRLIHRSIRRPGDLFETFSENAPTVRRFGFGLLFGIVGYIVAAVASYFLIFQLSSNMHDRSVEAGMTSAFFLGPIGGLIALVVGVIRGGRQTDASPNQGTPS